MDLEWPACTLGLSLFQRLAADDNRQRREAQTRLRAFKREHGEVRIHSAHCPFELP